MKNYSGQRGNVLFIILIALILLAALIFSMTRTGRTTAQMSQRDATFAANAIMRYGDDLKNAVQLVVANGTDISTLSFENGAITGYANASAAAKNKIFDTAGGGLSYLAPQDAWLDDTWSAKTLYGQWHFPENVCVASVGRGTTTCSSDSIDNEDIVVILPYVQEAVCLMIDRRLAIPLCSAAPCAATGDIWPNGNGKFTGSLTDGVMIRSTGGEMDGKTEGCLKGSGTANQPAGSYFYYKVLMDR